MLKCGLFLLNEIPSAIKGKQSTDGSYNGMHKHYAKRKKPVTKDHVLYDPISRAVVEVKLLSQ